MKKNYVVTTPAGSIYVSTAAEAKKYTTLYGFPYRRLTQYEFKKVNNE